MKIEIHPLENITIDSITVSLGEARTDVETSLGKGQMIGNRCYYFDSEMAIDYDENNKVEFIEFLGGVGGSLRPTLYGISIFDAHAYEVTALLSQKNAGEINDTEHGYSYAYKKISVGIYRETRPEDVAEMIEEMKSLGIEVEGNEDVSVETTKANHWATVGFGIVGYYK